MPEPDSVTALALFTQAAEVVAPDLVLAEVANALWKWRRLGWLLNEQFDDYLTRLPLMFTELVPLSELLSDAGAISRELDHPIYDCFYLALAEQRSDLLITVDKRLLAKARRSPWADRIVDLAST